MTSMHSNCSKGNAATEYLKVLPFCHTGADREPYGKPQQPSSLAAVLQHADVSGVMHAYLRLKKKPVMYLPSQVMFCLHHSLYNSCDNQGCRAVMGCKRDLFVLELNLC